MALTQIKSSNIADGTVAAADIADDSIINADIKSDAAIDSSKLGSIPASKLASTFAAIPGRDSDREIFKTGTGASGLSLSHVP